MALTMSLEWGHPEGVGGGGRVPFVFLPLRFPFLVPLQMFGSSKSQHKSLLYGAKQHPPLFVSLNFQAMPLNDRQAVPAKRI